MDRKLIKAALVCLLAWGGQAYAQFSEEAFDNTSFSPLAFEFGGEGATVLVPDCTTSPTTEAACAVLIEGESLVASSTLQCHGSVAADDVISTNPAAGVSVAEMSTVEMFVSTGTCPVYDTATGPLRMRARGGMRIR